MTMMRKVLGYAAMSVAVTVVGVVVGAVIIAPAVSRTRPLFDRAFNSGAESEGTGGAVGQADGDPMHSAALPVVSAAASFKPLADAIASSKKTEPALVAPRRTGYAQIRYQVADRIEDVLLAAGRVPKIFWIYGDLGAVLLLAGFWTMRRRSRVSAAMANLLPSKGLDKRLASGLPSRLVPGSRSRTPRAVASLAEAGNTPTDIARRTGLALDAVAMLIAMGSLGARQLTPPTA